MLTHLEPLKLAEQPLKERYSKLVELAWPKLMRVAMGFANDSDPAQDLIQAAVVKGYEKLLSGELQIEQDLVPWLKKVIARNYLQSLRKDKRILKDFDLEVHEPLEETTSHDPSHPMFGVGALLDEAIESLELNQKEVVVLVDLQGFEYEEAAEILEIPIGTVRSRLSRARYKLASKLRSQGVNP